MQKKGKGLRGFISRADERFDRFLTKHGIGMQTKLLLIFFVGKVIPLIILAVVAWQQLNFLGQSLKEIAVEDTSAALNDSAVENIERMTTDTARDVANFLYERDDDILYVAKLEPSDEAYETFVESRTKEVVDNGEWVLSEDGTKWVSVEDPKYSEKEVKSTNPENEDMEGFHYRKAEIYDYIDLPLYDEIAYIDLEGNEIYKYVSPNSSKVNHPFSTEKLNVSNKENTYVKAEDYFEKLKDLELGEIYVSDVIGAYVGSNFIGMYTPDNVKKAAEDRGYDIEYDPESQSYAGEENPNGERFEGIVRWATPVAGENGEVKGYVTFALNHDHIMEFVDHITPMNDRYTELPSAFEGNYAFIWDYECRNICHPRHHSIVGYDPETGEKEVPWLETSIYEAWQESGDDYWYDFVVEENWPEFDNQSREKKPAAVLTQSGNVGLDGRFLNNAPQCTGWMDLTGDGGSGSFYILWSGLYKLNTAGAIPYYTGQYAPSEENNFSKRGFGFVAIGAGLEDFAAPANAMEERLSTAIDSSLNRTSLTLIIISALIILFVMLIAIWIASSLTGNIKNLIDGISRFRSGERQFRFDAPIKNEFGLLADSFDEMADSIVDSVNNPMTITDMDRKVIYMNDGALEMAHISSLDEVKGKLYENFSIYPKDTAYAPIKALLEGKETEIMYDETSQKYIKGEANYFLSKSGEKIGYIITINDVTEMVKEQLEKEEQRLLLDEIFSASPDLIWLVGKDGRYLTVNPRFAAITGEAEDCFRGRTPEESLPEELAAVSTQYDAQAMKGIAPVYSEETVIFADGHKEILEAVRTPIIDEAGNNAGLLGFARNVTNRVDIESELRETQLDLKDAVALANAASQHKGSFLARMSHEIRTPMNAIIGITNIVLGRLDTVKKKADLPEVDEIDEHMHQIEASSQHLLGLLNDILDISKIEAGKIDLTQEPLDINKLSKTVVGIIQPRCDEKNIKFTATVDEFNPSTFIGDSLRLRQVLINLLGNAVKFTPECGNIDLKIQRLDQKDGKTFMRFVVQDDGIGIAEDARETIFKPFEQESAGISRQYGGTGLGLAISSNIVNLLGGEIELKSTLGEGSEFSFEIWMTETEAAEAEKDPAKRGKKGSLKGKRMLLVDDVEINRIIVKALLEDMEMEIDEASDGDVAVNMFKTTPPNTYDIILMDIQMPEMDGYTATEEIRALDRDDAKTVPIIALTANAFKEDIIKALDFGMNAHIAKPIEQDTLIDTLMRFVGD